MIVFINFKIFKLCMTFFNMTVSNLKRHFTLLEVSIFLSKLPNVSFRLRIIKWTCSKNLSALFHAQKAQTGWKVLSKTCKVKFFDQVCKYFVSNWDFMAALQTDFEISLCRLYLLPLFWKWSLLTPPLPLNLNSFCNPPRIQFRRLLSLSNSMSLESEGINCVLDFLLFRAMGRLCPPERLVLTWLENISTSTRFFLRTFSFDLVDG